MKTVLKLVAILFLVAIVAASFYAPTMIKDLKLGDVISFEAPELNEHPLTDTCEKVSITQVDMSMFRLKCDTEQRDFSILVPVSNSKQVAFYEGFDVLAGDVDQGLKSEDVEPVEGLDESLAVEDAPSVGDSRLAVVKIRENNIKYFTKGDVIDLILDVMSSAQKVIEKNSSEKVNKETWGAPMVKGEQFSNEEVLPQSE